MSLRELREWQTYAHRRLLPSRRLEFYLAQIALLIAKTMGGATKATLMDFLIQPARNSEPPDVDDDARIEQLMEEIDFQPVNKPRNRK
jgi:hypothetical protein